MSGNDQPPVPPQSPDAEPDAEPTLEPTTEPTPEATTEPTPDSPPESEAPEGEPEFVIQPGASDAASPSQKNRLIVAVAAAAAILVIAGGFLIWLLVDDDEDGDDKDEAKVVSTEDFCQGVADVYALDGETSKPVDIADGFRDAGVTEDLTDEQLAGREAVIEIGDSAKDNVDADAKYKAMTGEDRADADAFFTYIQTNCADQIKAKLSETE